ncbi:small acidic protein 1 [Diospyros lotus]|uniref:small acidic protein 1 n=1 Tax=Diospyros lotus TaxID=55363 RepID=UPI002251DCA3|nr:small acidic protein 1 [Diospyros lotus]
MKAVPVDYLAELTEQESVMAMDVDDVEALEIFGEGGPLDVNKLADADFFNSFQDDFDDSDIN